MKPYDAIVVGTGIAGLSTAIGLAHSGKRVLAIGRKALKGEASPAAAGILDPMVDMEPRNPMLALGLESFRGFTSFIRRLRARTGMDVGYARPGLLYLALSDAEKQVLRKRFHWQRRCRIPLRWLTREAILRKEPACSKRVRAALFYPTIGRVHPRRLMRAMERWAKLSGVSIRKYASGATWLRRGGAVAGVRVGQRTFRSGVIVNAAGAWAGAKGRGGGRLPVRPARGQLLLMKGRGPKIRTILHSLGGAYIVPWDSGEYLLGSTVEFVGYRPRITRPGVAGIRRRTKSMAPAISKWKLRKAWAGLRPCAKDRLPILGAMPLSGLYAATGFYRSGILIGFHAGQLLARGIVEGSMPHLLRPFSPGRFWN